MQNPAMVRLEGLHSIKHAIRFAPTAITSIYAADSMAVLDLAREVAPDIVEYLSEHMQIVTMAQLKAFVPKVPHTKVVAFAYRTPAAGLGKVSDRPVVVLDDPRNAGNVGATVRVAAGMGAGGVFTLSGEDPWNISALRGSAGLHFAIPVECTTTTEISVSHRQILGFDPEGVPLPSTTIADFSAIIFGSERVGLSPSARNICDQVCAIPMNSRVSSYNLATSVAIGLYHWRAAKAF